MGGALHDYEQWAMAVPGVTRAWAAAEMGPGTITVRFLMDDVYPDNHGLPTAADIVAGQRLHRQKRPVTVKDCYVVAPRPFFYDIAILNLTPDDPTVRADIEASINDMEFKMLRSKPGQTGIGRGSMRR